MTTSKDEFVNRLEIRLEEMNSDLEQFESRVRTLESSVRPEYIQHLTELDERRETFRREIQVVRQANELSWKRHRQAAEGALTALVAGMVDAKERLESELLEV